MTRELVMRNFVCKFVSEIMTRELVMAIADRGTTVLDLVLTCLLHEHVRTDLTMSPGCDD
eukprot:COSAG02_NODE_2652_length_8323_cov_32.383268_7_plen_60_part_00